MSFEKTVKNGSTAQVMKTVSHFDDSVLSRQLRGSLGLEWVVLSIEISMVEIVDSHLHEKLLI